MKPARRFTHLRDVHRTELAEDYVETILDLIEASGEARLTEIAQSFGVAHPTVSKALRRLESEGLVLIHPYRAIELTGRGRALARECRARHKKVVAFLVALGVDRTTAEMDAEGIEHHVSRKTLQAMAAFTRGMAEGSSPAAGA
jgi:DtxR family manganese transport transcriptional regulator